MLDAAAVRRWCRAAADDLHQVRAAIDALNVFPVPDADTGTNLHLTMVAAADAAATAEPDATWSALARAAMLGAHGNSGVILSQLLRGVAEHAPTDGASLAIALDHAAAVAYAAVGDPVEGTMLTVAQAAAAAATGTDVATVVAAAADGAWQALLATPGQLPTLAEAGVVDAGGAGLVVVLDALARVCSGATPTAEHRPRVPAPEHGVPTGVAAPRGCAYEVMYLLDADDGAVAALRERLAELGDSLVVVGGDDVWNVHVHVDDVGAAVEAAFAAGRPHRVRVTYLPDAHQPRPGGRCVVAVAATARLAELYGRCGAVPVMRSEASPDVADVCTAVGGAAEVVLVPDAAPSAVVLDSAAERLRADGLRVAVLPVRAAVQALAALAVHQPERPYDDDLVAMTTAAVGTAYAEAGGPDARRQAVEEVRRLLAGGDRELVTVLGGCDAPAGLLEGVTADLAATWPEVEAVGYEHAVPGGSLLIGVE
ncbi:MAG: DAK2 domain-containing protein [Streptosporangiales bacterium]|nr:DAK2 domain-containing protein [Streptosporangiales bacterium]